MPDADIDQAVDALVGAGYGSAGERCMAISVAVPVGQKTANALVKKLIPRVESLKVGPSNDPQADYGPMVTRAHMNKVRDYVETGIKEGAKLLVDGRGFKLQGYRERQLPTGRLSVRRGDGGHAHLQGRDFRARAVGRAREGLRGSRAAALEHGIRQPCCRSSPATATPRAISPRA